MSTCSVIMAIVQKNRMLTATKVQHVLTNYGCNIRVRLGLHDAGLDEVCSPSGLILLQLCCTVEEAAALQKDLEEIPEVKVKFMDLNM